MSLPTSAIQIGFISRYRSDVPLQGFLIGATAPNWNIYDWGGVPTGQTFPYVVIFPPRSVAGSAMSFGTDGVDSIVQVSVFTQAGGLAQARAVAKRIYDITNKKELGMLPGGFNQFFLMLESEQEMQEQDGITQMIVHKYHLMTQG